MSEDQTFATFVLEHGGREMRLDMPLEIWIQLENMARAALRNETGGYLIGHMKGEWHAEIALATPPPPDSQAGADFIRLGDDCSRVLPPDDVMEENEWFFQGVWHSHPEGGLEPSVGDHEDIKIVAATNPDISPIYINVAFDQGGYCSCYAYICIGKEVLYFGEPQFVGGVELPRDTDDPRMSKNLGKL